MCLQANSTIGSLRHTCRTGRESIIPLDGRAVLVRLVETSVALTSYYRLPIQTNAQGSLYREAFAFASSVAEYGSKKEFLRPFCYRTNTCICWGAFADI